MAEGGLQRIVIGVAHRGEIGVAGKVWAKGRPRAVDHPTRHWVIDTIFSVRHTSCGSRQDLARLTDAKAERRNTGVSLQIAEKSVPLCADVSNADDSVCAELPLHRHVV